MKKIFLNSTLIVLMLVAASCQSKKVDDPKSTEPVKIQLSIKQLVPTKAIGDAVDADNVINDIIVFVARDNGDLDITPSYFTDADIVAGVATITDATSDASKVYVVSNTGPFVGGLFVGATNMAQVERRAMAVDGNPHATSNCVSGNVWMYGSSDLAPAPANTEVRVATVDLKYIPAKVYVKIDNQIIGYDPANAGYTVIDGAFMFNAGSWTRFIENANNFKPLRTDITLPNNAPFFSIGRTMPATWVDRPAQVGGVDDYVLRPIYEWAPVATFPILTNTPIGTPIEQPFAEGFYVFPSITSDLTSISLFGRYNPNGSVINNAVGRVENFWTFGFGGPDGLSGRLASGNQYVITFKLTAQDATGGGGSEDPGELPIPTNIEITINTAEWIVQPIEKVFN